MFTTDQRTNLTASLPVEVSSEMEIVLLPVRYNADGSGMEIVARGVSAGPEVARILREVEDRWVAEGFRQCCHAVLAFLEQ